MTGALSPKWTLLSFNRASGKLAKLSFHFTKQPLCRCQSVGWPMPYDEVRICFFRLCDRMKRVIFSVVALKPSSTNSLNNNENTERPEGFEPPAFWFVGRSAKTKCCYWHRLRAKVPLYSALNWTELGRKICVLSENEI